MPSDASQAEIDELMNGNLSSGAEIKKSPKKVQTNAQEEGVVRWSIPVMEVDPQNVVHYEEDGYDPHNKRAAAEKTPKLTAIEKLKKNYIAQWREELKADIQQSIYEDAFAKGHTEGLTQGLEEAQEKTNQLQSQLTSIIHCLDKPLEQMNEEVEKQLELLAITLAQQLVKREIKNNPGEIVGLIRSSINLLPAAARHIKIFIHPDDATLMKQALSIGDEEELSWRFEEDPMLTQGGCIIKSDKSVIDVTLENRLATLVASVLSNKRSTDQTEVTAQEGQEHPND